MLSGQGNLAQSVYHSVLLINVHTGNRRHAQNGIHRRADIVAHSGQEITLCMIGRLRPLRRQSQYFILTLLLVNNLINAADCQCNSSRAVLSHLRYGNSRTAPLKVSVFVPPLIPKLYVFLRLKQIQNIGKIQKFLQLLKVFLPDNPRLKTA